MPWDGTRLVLGQLARSRHGLPSLRTTEVLAGDADTAIAQPCFSPDGRYLVYASDERGYSNLWCRDLTSGTTRCLYEDTSDVAGPAWAQGMRAFSWAADSRTLYFVRSENAQRLAYALDFASGAVTKGRGAGRLHPHRTVRRGPARQGFGLHCRGQRDPRSHRRGYCQPSSSPRPLRQRVACPRRSLHARTDFLGQRGRHPSPRAVLSSGQPPLYWPRPTAADCHDPRRPYRPSRYRIRGHQSVFCHPGLCCPRR